MKVRFQADNDLNQRIVMATRRLDAAIDFQTAVAAGLHLGIEDPEVLLIAAREGRVLVTRDRRTMPYHFERFLAEHTSPGLIILGGSLSIGRAAEWLHLIWAASEAKEYVNSICTVP